MNIGDRSSVYFGKKKKNPPDWLNFSKSTAILTQYWGEKTDISVSFISGRAEIYRFAKFPKSDQSANIIN